MKTIAVALASAYREQVRTQLYRTLIVTVLVVCPSIVSARVTSPRPRRLSGT
jgi:hypothetical protein